MILLDTHVLVWLDEGNPRLGAEARRRIDHALAEERLAVSAITFWEVATLIRKERLSLSLDPRQWRAELLGLGLEEIPVSGELGIAAAELADFHGDPANRLIVATALVEGAALVTADRRILGWEGEVERVEAER